MEHDPRLPVVSTLGQHFWKVFLDRLIHEMTTKEIDEAEQEMEAFRPKSFKEAFPDVVRANLNLQGIKGTKEKRLALVSGRSVEQGKSFEMSVAGFPVQVRCDLIERQSVKLSFAGQTVVLMLNLICVSR